MSEGMEQRCVERLLAGAVVATVFFLPLSESLKNISFGVGLATYIVTLLWIDRGRLAMPPVGWFFVAFMGVVILSALASEFPRRAWSGVWMAFRYLSFFFIVSRGIRHQREAAAVVWAAAAGTTLLALFAIYRYAIVGREQFSWLSLGYKNGAAEYLTMVLPLMLGMSIRPDVPRRVLWVLGTGAAAILVAVGLSNSRTAWMVLAAVALLFVALRRAWIVLPAVGLVLVVVAVVSWARPDVARRVGQMVRPETYTVDFGERRAIWRASLHMWWDHPWLGTGPRTFKVDDDLAKDPNRRRYGVEQSIQGAHNLWLHAAAETGSLGVVAMSAWLVAVGRLLLLGRERFRGHPLSAVWDGAVGALAAIVLTGFTESLLGLEHSMYFVALLGILMRPGEMPLPRPEPLKVGRPA